MKSDLEKMVERLEKARNRAGSYGRKFGKYQAADDVLKIVYAQLEDKVPDEKKTIPEKDAWIRRQSDYIEAVEEKTNVAADWKTAEIYMKLLLEEVGALRSQEATNRWIDKSHT